MGREAHGDAHDARDRVHADVKLLSQLYDAQSYSARRRGVLDAEKLPERAWSADDLHPEEKKHHNLPEHGVRLETLPQRVRTVTGPLSAETHTELRSQSRGTTR